MDALIEEQLETLIPTHADELRWMDIQAGTAVRYRIWRDPLRLSVSRDRILGSVRLYFWAEGGLALNGSVVKVASCGKDSPRIIDVSFQTTISMGRVHTTVESVNMINRCTPTLFRINVSERIRQALSVELQRFAGELDRALEQQVPELTGFARQVPPFRVGKE